MTDIEIINAAATRCGCAPITDLAEDTATARVARAQYPGARDFMLADREWTVTMKRKVLARAAQAPEFRYSYQYIIPSDVLKVVRCYPDTDGDQQIDDWQREGEYVVTNEAAVYAEVQLRIPENRFSPGMVQALEEYLIHVMAIPLTENRQLAADGLVGYEAKVTMAASTDAMQGRVKKISPPRLPGRIR